MQQQVSVITLPVSDLAKSKAFYVDALGWTPVFDDGDVVFFQFNGFVLGLWSRASFDSDIHSKSVVEGHKMALGHNVGSREEVDALIGRMVSFGAKKLRQATPLPWGGYSGNVSDIDGHVWEIAHNPKWEISEEGYVRFKS